MTTPLLSGIASASLAIAGESIEGEELAGAVGAVSALKAQGARQVGDPETAALLPAKLDFMQPEPMAD